MIRLMWVLAAWMAVVTVSAAAQQPPAPRPFPEPGQRPAAPPPQPPAQPAPVAAPVPSQSAPSESSLGVPIYPTAQFITSYDAGRGQRFYLFGVALPFAEAVQYYRAALKSRGDVLFESPGTHQFEIARFRDDLMAFPPSVTIKDYTFGGSAGYPNPNRGTEPERFPTVIQIVPAPAGVK
jgi:hypothetical protein